MAVLDTNPPLAVAGEAERASDKWGARLPFRWPRGETGKILVFTIPVASG